MKNSSLFLFVFVGLVSLNSCTFKAIEVDLIVHNATVYTVNERFEKVEAFAVKDGRIVELGAERAIMNKYKAANVVDAQQKFVYPGFIDSHCHFLYYGKGVREVDLTGALSWDEVVERVNKYAENNDVDFIYGRGWDQNLWENKDFPSNQMLNEYFPDKGVLLERVDGHAVIVNDYVLQKAGIQDDVVIDGGSVVKENGKLTGVLIDNAIYLINETLPPFSDEAMKASLLAAQEDCFKYGLSTVDDAGLSRHEIEVIQQMQESGALKMRIYAMVRDNKADLNYFFDKGIIQTDRLTVRSVKAYADGALGSRGASLLAPYSDKPEEWGFLVNSYSHFDSLAGACYEAGFQLNTHCIGDSANRLLTDVYSKYLKGTNDHRWRIEHAQIIHRSDLYKFKDFSIIPSVQPTHATSDMYWAEDRLGEERMNEAYPYQSLLKENGLLALGTDFPVEQVNPMLTFYAAVSRQDLKGFPEGSFIPEEKLSRKEALMGMTIWGAIANFEENEKGSLAEGKVADFVIMEADIMTIPEEQLPDIKVSSTFINGEEVYQK
jgi:predicted amidohydrolase YtcJ